ncbi:MULTISPECIES: sucrose-specific PTS transporter subunit IIBC [Corynebacterium]|uniref:protein-N(pi)-phosphohistidine--sucrose phosphotransferase n=1 Tax=Corynebacterium amycolatum TaxID=43765 RepID=A0AAW9SPW2_CORAY|nr:MULTISPECIES: sucrose-specific PTS transporter subunit IIBC [Corynebacterium]MBC6762260.1 PTS beta-glucoside transporter subunit EIIBCA [Corynebacterium sp. LK27]MCQ9171250.1 PTS transporter subunit EIIC [Corynebacterium amycolatum]MDK7110614.1 sucrose-specific PTS transporter subunit IIBC [Corynebacterium amycolatum]MDK7145078.1 sucrose-specific PTS transporter subunit IIBC [Corynebacterium amycolatum]MDK7236838.1 sucrose-specific PTS transporter subunit IIBC [Corynebacterium amycolatum]
MDHRGVAARTLAAIGGEENVVGMAHCATRLRMVLKDSKKVDKNALESDPDLKGIFEAGGMFQVIVGPGDVNIVFDEISKMSSKDIAVSTDKLKDIAANSGNWFSRFIKVLADIFVPLIPILVGGGLLMALNNVLTAEGLFGEQSVIQMFPAMEDVAGLINLLASAPFAFLPVLVGFTATKRFGGNEFLGAGIAMAMVMPDLVNGYQVAEAIQAGEMPYWDIFGLNVAQAGYQGSILPILVISWILATIEKFFHKRLKGTVDFMLTPLLTLLITGFITFAAIGPVLRTAGEWLGIGLANLYEFAGPVGGFLFGLVYSPIVITGLHQSFPPIEYMLWDQGGSFIFATASMANIAQGGAALAVYFLAKSEKLKGLAGASGMSALFGITEPAIFGVNLRLRWPFYIGMGASAIASTMIAILDVKATALGAAGFVGFVSMRPTDIMQFFLCALVSLAISFTCAFLYGRFLVSKNGSVDPDEVGTATPTSTVEFVSDAAENAFPVASPLEGTAVALPTVSDPMFAGGKLGQGVAVEPTVGKLVAPISGKVMVTFPTKHAYAMRGFDAEGNKVDILMHIGFDTVNLKGEHFTSLVNKGDEVQQGDTLAEFDIEAIKAAGYPVTTPVVISNSKKTGPVLPAEGFRDGQPISFGAPLLTVDPKVKDEPKPEPATTAEKK